MLMWAGTSRKTEAEIDIDSDRRGDKRISLRCPISLSQTSDGGRVRSICAHALDISSSGALIHASRPMSIDADVRIRGNELLVGAAQVRHCSRQGFGFRIGLEFATDLTKRF
jgi:hypothetical protein